MEHFCIGLPEDMAQWLRAAAKAEGRSVTSVVRRGLMMQIAAEALAPPGIGYAHETARFHARAAVASPDFLQPAGRQTLQPETLDDRN